MVLPQDTYNRYMNSVSRYTPRRRVLCDCGREVFETQMEKHQQTKLHFELLRRKDYVAPDPKIKPIHPAFIV
jgi:hypothetical protein